MRTITISSLDETKELGLQLASLVQPGMLITLTGDLGAGKTTFTKSLGKGIGINKVINSPTFNILKIYKGSKMPLYHIDAYRLEGIHQDLGFEEYFESDGLCVVEWPNFIEDQLPEHRLQIKITIESDENGDKRVFSFEPYGSEYEKVVEALK